MCVHQFIVVVQVKLVGDILSVVRSPIHTAYVLDDALESPVHVQVWKVGNETQPEQHELIWVIKILFFFNNWFILS